MDKGPEWRAFTQEEKASEAESVFQLLTQFTIKAIHSISQVDRDAFGRKLPFLRVADVAAA